MKYLLILLACVSSLLPSALAKEEKKDPYKLPKGMHVAGQLEKAKTQAEKEKKPIAFLITIEGFEKDDWVARTTEKFLDIIERKTVLVYVDAKLVDEKKSDAPELVLTKLTEMRRAAKIPIVVITDATVSKILTSVSPGSFIDPKTDTYDNEKAAEFLKKEMRELAK